jgi:hypothetical protein
MSQQVKSANVTTSNVTLIRNTDGVTIATAAPTLATDKVTITLTPSASLDNGVTYYVVVQNQVAVTGSVAQSPSPWYGDSRQSNAGLFTTVTAALPTPSVTSITPGNNTGGVAITTTVAVLMNTAIQSADVTTANLKLIQASNSNVVTINSPPSLSADGKTITLTPSANLANSTQYYTTVANLHNASAVVQSPNPYNPFAPGTLTSVYNLATSNQSNSLADTGSQVNGYGVKATAANGLTTGPIQKVVVNQINVGGGGTANVYCYAIDAAGNFLVDLGGGYHALSGNNSNVTFTNASNTTTLPVGGAVFVYSSTGAAYSVTVSVANATTGDGEYVQTNTAPYLLTADSTTNLAANISVIPPATGANAFTTGSSGYVQRYLIAQTTTPCGNTATSGWDPFIGGNLACSSCSYGIGGTPSHSGTPTVGVAYGQKATASNGLTTKPITKVVIPAVGGSNNDWWSTDQSTPPTGTLGIKIVNSAGTTKYTFGQTIAASSTGYAQICTVNSDAFNGWVNFTFTDTSNTYTMVAGDCILVTWTGTGDNVLLLPCNSSGTGNAVYLKGTTITAISGHDFAATMYSSS